MCVLTECMSVLWMYVVQFIGFKSLCVCVWMCQEFIPVCPDWTSMHLFHFFFAVNGYGPSLYFECEVTTDSVYSSKGPRLQQKLKEADIQEERTPQGACSHHVHWASFYCTPQQMYCLNRAQTTVISVPCSHYTCEVVCWKMQVNGHGVNKT